MVVSAVKGALSARKSSKNCEHQAKHTQGLPPYFEPRQSPKSVARNAPNFKRSIGCWHDLWIGAVGCFKKVSPAGGAPQKLERVLVVNDCQDDVPDLGLYGTIYQHIITVKNSFVLHGIPGNTEEERGLGMLNKNFCQVDRFDCMIFRRAWKASAHAAIHA